MTAGTAVMVVAQWVAAGFVLHIALEGALRTAYGQHFRRPVVRLALAAAVLLLVSPVVGIGDPSAQRIALGIAVLAHAAVWMTGVDTVSRLTGTQPPRGYRPLLAVALSVQVVAFASGTLVERYTDGAGPVFSSATLVVAAPPLVLALWWVASIIRTTGRPRLARQVRTLIIATIPLGAVTLLVEPVRTTGLGLLLLPGLWWVVTAARVTEEAVDEAADHAHRTAARLQRELAGAHDDIERAEAVSRALVDAASHELRTPLAVILAGVEMLERTDLPPEPRTATLELVMRNARRLNELVEYLLAAKSTADPARRPRPSLTTITGSLRSALAVHDDLEVTIDCPDDLRAWADPLDLALIVTALVSNAQRHGGPNVSIEVGGGDTDVVVRVEDDGDGVDEAYVERLFLPFEQPTSGLSRLQTGGLGLGLAVARDRARANGGDLTYTRLPGRTCFELRVPASHATAARAQAAAT